MNELKARGLMDTDVFIDPKVSDAFKKHHEFP